MRTASQFLGPLPLIAFVISSCAYDAELMGDPEPEVTTEPIYIEAQDDAEGEMDIALVDMESPESTPVEFAASDENRIFAPVDSLDMFADLRFFGSWYYHDQYAWVWRPTVSRIWAPMRQGYWAWTENDWMWVTHDRFGSDPYNYGYWVEDTALGWVWVPDCSWQPLRCQLIQWDTYVAWAPLLPPDEGEYRDPWTLHSNDSPWITVRLANFMKYDVSRYKIPPKFSGGESEQTIVRGPVDIERLEKVLGRRIERIHIPWRQPPVLPPVIVEVSVPIDPWQPLPPELPMDPCPPSPLPPVYDLPRSDPGKMKGTTPNPPQQQKPSQPRNFKEAAQDPPKGGGKSKAK